MGYTHYYGFRKGTNQERINELFPKAVELFKEGMTLLPKRPCDAWGRRQKLELGDWEGQGEPTIKDNKIIFNGKGDSSYETFSLHRRSHSEFCKTARQPYDLAVCMCLLCFKEVFGDDFEYSSDGYCPEDESVKDGRKKLEYEWAKAVKYFNKLMMNHHAKKYVSA